MNRLLSSVPLSPALLGQHRPAVANRGFSLVEMLVTVAIFGILLAFAAPAVQEMIAGQRVRNAATELYESLIYARSEAIKRAENVTFVTDGFVAGWDIETASEADPIRVQGPFDNVTFDPADADIAFNRLGRLTGSAVEVEISRSDTSYVRCVQLQTSGKPKVINGACP